MIGKTLLTMTLLILLLLQTEGRKSKRVRGHLKRNRKQLMLSDDPLIQVTAIRPKTMIGQCSCTCCEPQLDELVLPPCMNDIIVAVDSSACFRDYYRRMIGFVHGLIGAIDKDDNLQFGRLKTRLGVMQFSSEIKQPIRLSAYSNFGLSERSNRLKSRLQKDILGLEFLGEGAYLNKALNETVKEFDRVPRDPEILENGTPRKVVILLTNGKSHPSVTEDDVDQSVSYLRENGVTVIPISVTRECLSMSSIGWDEGLCPDTTILNKIAKLGRNEDDEFVPMKSGGVYEHILSSLSNCHGLSDEPERLTAPACNNCTCDCELPIGPEGPQGPRGLKGDFVAGPEGPRGQVGSKGEPGDQGPEGREGPRGLDGIPGPEGPQGDIGPEGPIGPKGNTGEKGDVGPRGPQGDVGDQGEVGPGGPMGPKGETGRVGPKGDTGIIGPKGSKGEEGPDGPRGEKGEPGIGIKGDEGPRGPEGPRGLFGPPGQPGDDGPPGPRGLCGKPGPAGAPGSVGLSGIDGVDGNEGPPGTQGPRGPEGVQGEKGEQGAPGFNGPRGSTGPQGRPGPIGPPGPQGATGEKGEPSNVAGVPGVPGMQGSKGERGIAGRDGLDGRQGSPGTQGPQGQPGPSGPPAEYNLEELRPLIAEIVRELMPGECVETPPLLADDIRCREYPIDLVFLIDGSDSIDREDFAKVKSWILATIDSFKPMEREAKLHVDVAQFSENTEVEVHALIEENSSEIADALNSISQMRSGTKTYSALRHVNENVSPLTREGSYKILITMTDGDASEDRDPLAIAEARSFYEVMLGVGVGAKVHRDQLADFASSDGTVFAVTDFAALDGIIKRIVDESCQSIGQEISRQEAEKNQPTTITRRARQLKLKEKAVVPDVQAPNEE